MTSRWYCLGLADIAVLALLRATVGWITHPTSGVLLFSDALASAGPLAGPGKPASLVFWVAIIPALWVTGSYSRHRGLNAPLRIGGACLLAAAATTVPLAAVLGLGRAAMVMSVMGAIALAGLLPARWIAEWFMGSVWPRHENAAPALIVGPRTGDAARLEAAVSAGGGDYRVAGHHQVTAGEALDTSALAAAIGRMIRNEDAEAVILTEALPDGHLQAIVEEALSFECLVLCPPRAVSVEGLRPRLVWHRDQPLLEFSTPALQQSALLAKRIVDVVGGTALLLAASPFMLFIAAGIKLDSRGPVFFLQERAGVGGRGFRMLKFRTMRMGADDEKHLLAHLNHTGDTRLFKIPSDPRVTRFGAMLRRWSLDELPQFWNVLRGEMSLVGPRPFFEADFAAYEDHHFRRLETKPGITGLWQIGGRSNMVNFEDVVFLDRQYIENWSLWLDLEILIRTIPSVVRRTGAY